MRISSCNKNKKNTGFTIVELVVVLAGLAALSAFTIPGVLNQIKLSKAEETKALMNSYAADCLGKYRTSIKPSTDYVNKVEPTYDTQRLDNLGYKIDGNNKTCTSFSIKPKDDNEKFFYGLKFEVIGGNIIKTGFPSGSPPPEGALRSCKNWAGQNCGMTEEQKAKLAAERELQKRIDDCDANYYEWEKKARLANSDLQGSGLTWNLRDQECSTKWWAYGGKIGPNEIWYNAEIEKAIGKKCNSWRETRIAKQQLTDIESKPNGETDSNCRGQTYWFTLDKSFKSKSDWEEQVTKDAFNLCTADVNTYKSNSHNGSVIIKPKNGPLPCGTELHFCNGIPTSSISDWDLTPCGIAKKNAEEAAKRAAAEAAAKKAAEKKKLEDKDIPKTVKGRIPGSRIKCKTPMPSLCNSPKWRRLIPDCKCWFPNG